MTTQNFQYTKISELPETTRTDNDSLLVVNVDGETKKITFSNLKTLITQSIVQALTVIYDRIGNLESAVSSLLRRMNNVEDVVDDFDIENPIDGQVLKYDADTEKWVNGSAGGGSSTLANLTDVDLDNVANGQILKYNSSTQKWENENESGGSSYTRTELFKSSDDNGVWDGTNGITLSDSIENYDDIEIILAFTNAATDKSKNAHRYGAKWFADTFAYVSMAAANPHALLLMWSGQGFSGAWDSTNKKIMMWGKNGTAAIWAVYGIKY